MKREDLEGLIRRYWQEVWNDGASAAVAELYAPDCVHGDAFSIEDFQRKVERWRAIFPDFRVVIDDLFSVGDRVISRVTYHGTQQGTFAGLSPRGKEFHVTGIDIFRIRDGKIVEHWHEADHYTMLVQLGAVFSLPQIENE